MIERGRDKFKALRGAFMIMEGLLRALPKGFSRVLLSSFRPSNSQLARARRYLALRRVAQRCGELVDVRGNCFLIAPAQMTLGSRISVHPFCYIDATGGLTIGDDVSIAHGVSILTTEHRFADLDIPIRDQGVDMKPTTLGSNIWIGAGVRILAGTKIGDGAIVAAGAVVTSDVQPNTIVAGVPARMIRHR